MLALMGATRAVAENADASKNRPVTKVINLLKDMLKQLEKEASEDEDIYNKMACWCETNDKEKTKSIADAEARIAALTTAIEELTANSAKLNTEIKHLNKEVAENQESLDKATAMREKQLAEFNEDEKDMLQSISALKAAITVLSKHNGGSLAQVTSAMQLALKSKVLAGVFTPTERKTAAAFIQAPEDYFDAAPTFKQSYAPQSGAIFGILTQMKETFEKNLATTQKEEQANQKAYEELKAAKEEEIAAGQEQVDTKTQELADTDEKLAQSKQDIEDTRKSLSADEEFLMMLKEKCQMTDKEWEERQATRQLEMEACSKALSVLSSDEAHDLFTRTFNPSFVQEAATKVSDRRSKASSLLSETAKKLQNPRLAALAVKVKLDAFEKVKKAIDDMVSALMKEKADEIKHKDFCVDEFNTNKLDTEKKEAEKKNLIATIDDLSLQIESLTKAIDGLKAEIEELQVQLKRAGEDREKQNKEFQVTIADQRETQKMLQAALDILAEFYGKAALLQEPAGPPPPAGFEEYKKNAASGGVMGMLKQIISDAASMEAEAQRAEEESQKAYEDFVKETNASVDAKNKDIANKSEEKAKAEEDLVEAKEAKENTLLDLEQLSNYNAELHQSCDFVLKNFDLRQQARDEEVEALKQAKAILSGANFKAFLQKY